MDTVCFENIMWTFQDVFGKTQISGVEIFGQHDIDMIRFCIEYHRHQQLSNPSIYSWFPHQFHWIVLCTYAFITDIVVRHSICRVNRPTQYDVERILVKFFDETVAFYDKYRYLKEVKELLGMQSQRSRSDGQEIPMTLDDVNKFVEKQLVDMRNVRNNCAHSTIPDYNPDLVDIVFLSIVLEIIQDTDKNFDRMFIETVRDYFGLLDWVSTFSPISPLLALFEFFILPSESGIKVKTHYITACLFWMIAKFSSHQQKFKWSLPS